MKLQKPDKSLPIGPQTRVSLCFEIRLADGQRVDGTPEDRPATFEVGDGQLLPGFERALFDLCAGDARVLELPAEAAFGAHREENVQRLPKAQFVRAQIEGAWLEEGMIVSFADPSGTELPGVIRHLGDDWVEVDFNHPLAGRDVHFDVRITKVEKV